MLHEAIQKTEAIVLRIRDVSNTSHSVTWLSPEYGKLTTLIKGAARPKSAFLGQYDIGYVCELLFYGRDRGGLHIARECAPVALRDGVRGAWRKTLALLYACDVTCRVAEAGSHSAELYAPLKATLDAIERGDDAATLLAWYETRLLVLLGHTPNFVGCPHCAAEGATRFLLSEGRTVCRHCHAERAAALILAPATVRQMAAWIACDAPPAAAVEARTLTELRRFLGLFMRYHLDIPLSGRDMVNVKI